MRFNMVSSSQVVEFSTKVLLPMQNLIEHSTYIKIPVSLWSSALQSTAVGVVAAGRYRATAAIITMAATATTAATAVKTWIQVVGSLMSVWWQHSLTDWLNNWPLLSEIKRHTACLALRSQIRQCASEQIGHVRI